MNRLTDNQLLELSITLAQSVASQQRFDELLSAIRKVITCDAIMLLAHKGDYLQPLAHQGLSHEILGRRFVIAEHPRFVAICQSLTATRFPAECELADPYDGLLTAMEGDLPVHACMGIPLYFQNQLLGVLTLDSLSPGVFDSLSERSLALIASMASVSLHTALTVDLLEANVSHSQEVLRALSEPSASGCPAEIIGQSPCIDKLKNEISLVAPSIYSVLIEGESGTGKELVAHSVHQQSSRGDQALIYVNCAALPENLVESELFGHIKGAFTGAERKRAGKFVIASGGTLFLDEVGELPLAAQSKLLRALQSNEVQPVGQDEVIKVDVRVIAATNRDLKAEVESGRFRSDLYHRLNVYPLKVPPLRERMADIPLLAGFFIERARRKLGVNQLKISPTLLDRLVQYAWPGNVREFEHLLNRAALKACAKVPIHSRHDSLVTVTLGDCDELHETTQRKSDPLNTEESTQTPPLSDIATDSMTTEEPINLRQAVDDYQRQIVKHALQAHQGNWSRTAKHLGVDRANLIRLAKRLQIHVEKVVF
ncbi:nitric oxide reductase transcriptional regulator NorR [Pseudoalteromonas ruthenica]|uniref:nitric oxide reductase transcriptional regulator NorR n=1 Tax=Pseudoalteromonas ruthenica TaxID=151081 RepID=UPI00110B90D2|nr:nitric oxide reductase transcriptional regulator NorR [Pseudoalteromonas ruthenica]TMO43333.1 nitric oxide reductase transcriptional regulator NorR [Pseudoalteromonas ruthenica]TMO48885.1 nitric oxide reductase transcriptional regulator NorR [Pseudoalteromonas ruthenica]